VAVNEPPAEPVQERVAVPEAVRLVGFTLHVRLDELETLLRETALGKPPTYVTVIVEVPATPTAMGGTEVGFAATAKSGCA